MLTTTSLSINSQNKAIFTVMNKRLLALGLCLLIGCTLYAQLLQGLPEIVNYTKDDIQAGNQNWKIRQGSDGLLYAANNDGLLCFDGYRWVLHRPATGLGLRSLEVAPDGKLYVGSVDDLGYFEQNEQGKFTFFSLKRFIPEADHSFGDIWSVSCYQDAVFFRSGSRIFRWHHQKMTVYRGSNWRFLGIVDGQLLAQDQRAGLLSFTPNGWQQAPFKIALPNGAQVIAILPLGKAHTLLITQNHGLYSIKQDKAEVILHQAMVELSSAIISAATSMANQQIAIATRSEGLFIIDSQLQITDHFTRSEGLHNNHIMSVYADSAQNIWLGLDNGIDFIAYNSPIRKIYPDKNDIGAGYAAAFYKNGLYLGTANGLYKTTLRSNTQNTTSAPMFTKIAGSKGQVWNLNTVNDRLYMAHHEGAFVIENDQAISLDRSVGYWNFLPMQDVEPAPTIVAGNYKGIATIAKERLPRAAGTTQVSARFVEKTNDHVWVCHPSRGLFRIERWSENPVLEAYALTGKAQAANRTFIFSINQTLVLCTDAGIFEYDPLTDAFVVSAQLDALFEGKTVNYLKYDTDGNVWFVQNKTLGYITGYPAEPALHFLPEFTNKLLGNFEMVSILPNQQVIIGAESGFYLLDAKKYRQQQILLRPRIMQARVVNQTDSLFFTGNGVIQPYQEFDLLPGWTSLQFQFAAPAFGHQNNVEYSFRLEGYEKNWSAYSKKTEKEYTNLPPGNYRFAVKASNNQLPATQIATIDINVLPKWYQTLAFKCFLLLVFLAVAITAYKRHHRKIRRKMQTMEKEQSQLRYLQQLEIDKAEKELVKLQNEKLESAIVNKNTELASSAMHLVQKAEFINKLRDELIQLTKQPTSEQTIQALRKLIKTLGEANRIDAEWDLFANHFDQVHNNFLDTLKHLYPKLSANELKLCAYLRINLSTKEIAQLLNISNRGVEISRYRLRKKLDIPHGESLYNFLYSITEVA